MSFVELRDSTIENAGQGLFATRRIQPKQFLTEYPGITMSFKEFQDLTKTAGELNDYDRVNELNEYTQYCGKKDGEDCVIIASKNMRTTEKGLGHLVNDGGDIDLNLLEKVCIVINNLPQTPPGSQSNMSMYFRILSACMTACYLIIIRYLITSYMKRNILVGIAKTSAEDNKVVLISEREILPNTELFHSYGVDYWLKKALNNMVKNNPSRHIKDTRLPKPVIDIFQMAQQAGKMTEKDIWRIIKEMTKHIGVKRTFSKHLKLEMLKNDIIAPMKRMEEEIDEYLQNPHDFTEPEPEPEPETKVEEENLKEETKEE